MSQKTVLASFALAASASGAALVAPRTSPAYCDGVLFTGYTEAPAAEGPCVGPSTTTCFPLGQCAVLPEPAYSWSSIGGQNFQGYLYLNGKCSGDYFTEHFDADGSCFDPTAFGGPAGTAIQSFCVSVSNAKCAPVYA